MGSIGKFSPSVSFADSSLAEGAIRRCAPERPPLRGGSREAGGGENLRYNPLPLHLVPHLHNTTIYTLPKSTIKTLSKKPKKVLDKGHTPCYNNQAVSRGGQPLKLVTTACMAILKPKGFKKYRKKFLTNALVSGILNKLSARAKQRVSYME